MPEGVTSRGHHVARDGVIDDGHDGCECNILCAMWVCCVNENRLAGNQSTTTKGRRPKLGKESPLCEEQAENQLPFVAFASWQETTEGVS
jgi:hypothetical protein